MDQSIRNSPGVYIAHGIYTGSYSVQSVKYARKLLKDVEMYDMDITPYVLLRLTERSAEFTAQNAHTPL